MSPTAPSPDPRVGLRAGWMNAGSAAWNLRLVSAAPKPAQFTDDTNPGDFAFLNSDVAFTGHYAIQGNFHGLQVWDISQPRHPTLVTLYVCPDAQNDVSVYRNLLFVSGEDFNGRLGCAASASSTSATSRTPRASPTCRRAAARTRTPWSPTRATRRTYTSTCRARPRSAHPLSFRAARTSRRTRTRTASGSASR